MALALSHYICKETWYAMKNGSLLLENYLRMIEQLPEEEKLEMIVQLSKMLQAKRKKTNKSAAAKGTLFGALDDQESAEAWIKRIRSARNFDRPLESL